MRKYEFEQEVFSAGKWNGDEYTETDLDEMVQNFTELSEVVKPPVKIGHDVSKWKDGLPSLGWITGLRKEGQKLIAKFSDVPELIYKAIKEKLYKRVSSEIYWNYKNAGKVYRRVFAGLALLGADVPAVTNLKDLEVFLSQLDNTSTFEEVRAYDIINNETDGGHNMTDQEKKDYEDKLAAEKAAREKADADRIKAENELKEFKAKEAVRLEAEKKAKEMTAKAEFNAFLDAEVKAFRMTPACAEILKGEGKHSYSDEAGISVSLATLKEYQAKVAPILDKKEFGRQDGTNDNVKDIQSEVDSRVKVFMADKKVGYAEALTAVLDADKELADRYVSDIGGKDGK